MRGRVSSAGLIRPDVIAKTVWTEMLVFATTAEVAPLTLE